MKKGTRSTRRSFLKGGALLAAPLAAIAAPAAALAADDDLKRRLARLENEAAIRELHQGWLRRVNSATRDTSMALFADPQAVCFDQAVRSVSPDLSRGRDVIDVAADGKSAAGRFPCVVETESAIPRDCTLAEMAHAQGSGFLRRTEWRVLQVEYVKASGAWAIQKAEFLSI